MNAPQLHSAFARAVSEGLSASPKRLSPKWLYDARGSALFEKITDLPEYYPTRTEIALLREVAPQLAAGVGEGASVIEFGAGSAAKTPLLLAALAAPALYAPIDISTTYLEHSAAAIAERFPALKVRPILGDFTRLGELPADIAARDGPRLGFFPGSTIGNLEPGAMMDFLRSARRYLGPGAQLIVGVDTPKARDILIPAYDDAEGVTAAFNLNLLERMKRELGADLDVNAFHHEARWNEALSRIEMHIVSDKKQIVDVGGMRFRFAPGESIHSESSHKIAPETFLARAREAGWVPDGLWLAQKGMFSIHRLRG